MNATDKQHRAILQRIARRAMIERGLLPDFSAEALAELGRIQAPATMNGGQVRDLRHLLWASIDNDDSRDLDQLTVAEAMPGDKVKILVAVADVDSVVKSGSAIDEHARHNTTSVYTAADDLPDASREAVHRPHVAGFQRGSAGDRRRDGGRRGRLRPGLRHLPGVRPEPGEARLQQRCRMAGRRNDARRPSPPCRGLMRTCASRTGRRSG